MAAPESVLKDSVGMGAYQVRAVPGEVGVDTMVVVVEEVVVVHSEVVVDPAIVVLFVVDQQFTHQLVAATMDSPLYFSRNSRAHSRANSRAHNHHNRALSLPRNPLSALFHIPASSLVPSRLNPLLSQQ